MAMIGSDGRIQEAVKLFLARKGYLLSRHGAKHRGGWMDQVTRIKGERTLLLSHGEACQLIGAVQATAKVSGEIAEVGVAYGASARLIVEHAAGRPVHLFDTFDGLPVPGAIDSPRFVEGDFKSSMEDVRKYVGGLQTHFYRGLFPSTAGPVESKKFSFVHLDVDLYESTRDSLKFFYPRLSPGGILISHDFVSSDGVDAAFREFFADKPEPVIELTGYQCMFVKLA